MSFIVSGYFPVQGNGSLFTAFDLVRSESCKVCCFVGTCAINVRFSSYESSNALFAGKAAMIEVETRSVDAKSGQLVCINRCKPTVRFAT